MVGNVNLSAQTSSFLLPLQAYFYAARDLKTAACACFGCAEALPLTFSHACPLKLQDENVNTREASSMTHIKLLVCLPLLKAVFSACICTLHLDLAE